MWDLNNLWKPITRAFYCVHSDEGFIRRRSEKATPAKQNDGDTFLPPVFIWLAIQLPCRINDTCTFDTCTYQGYTVNSCWFDCVIIICAVHCTVYNCHNYLSMFQGAGSQKKQNVSHLGDFSTGRMAEVKMNSDSFLPLSLFVNKTSFCLVFCFCKVFLLVRINFPSISFSEKSRK